MCPDSALLVAYLDETLFIRDKTAVDEHVATCANCTDLLAAMRRARAAEQRAKRTRALVIGGSIAGVMILASGVWAFLFSSGPAKAGHYADAGPRPSASIAASSSQPAANAPAAVAESPAMDAKVVAPAPRNRRKSEAAVTGPTRVEPAPNQVQIDGDVVLRGRRANRRIVWRTRDRVVEHSTDAGGTWTTEYTADHAIRAGTMVDANVAWLVGESGLVLRRTGNGWFGATPPADGRITAVRASSPSKATVTLEDGRVFSTENGGVTWSTR